MEISEMKSKKVLKVTIPLALILVFMYWYTKDFFFLKVKIDEGYYIQQKPFTSNHVLKSKKNGAILENIYEWKVTDRYIYGSCNTDEKLYYVYDKEKNDLQVFDFDSFHEVLVKLNLRYTMDNTTRVMDFKRIN